MLLSVVEQRRAAEFSRSQSCGCNPSLKTSKRGTRRRALVERAGQGRREADFYTQVMNSLRQLRLLKALQMEPDTKKALAMLDAFASVGARVFDLSILDIHGEPVKHLQRTGRSLDEMRRRIGVDLQAAARNRHSVVIRPRSKTALLVQIDDRDEATAAKLEPFMVLTTSPGNGQIWIAVADGPPETDIQVAKEFRRRVRKATGADTSATGATRVAGSFNFKTKYAPDFPMIEISQAWPGRTTTAAALEAAGFLPPPENYPAPRRVPQPTHPQGEPSRKWPDYQQALRGAPLTRDGSGPDRSLADFMWSKWASERGWEVEAIAAKLVEVSERAQERVRMRDEGYALVTAKNAAAAVQRERGQRQSVKSTPRPARLI